MLRLNEFGLFIVPFALYAAWLVLGSRLPRRVVWATIALIVAMVVGTLWYGLTRKLDTDESYAPARLVNGVVVEGHGVPK